MANVMYTPAGEARGTVLPNTIAGNWLLASRVLCSGFTLHPHMAPTARAERPERATIRWHGASRSCCLSARVVEVERWAGA